MSNFNHEEVDNLLRECADRFVMPRFRQLNADEIVQKSAKAWDIQTVADREAEAYLELMLPKILPGSLVLGEEAHSAGRQSFDLLGQDDHPVWVIDPVDGTYNFARGSDKFCTMVALVHAGRTRMAWIYDPNTDILVKAARGGGAWCGKETLHVGRDLPLNEIKGYGATRNLPKNVRSYVEEQAEMLNNLTTLGCAGHEYLRVAAGEMDFAFYQHMMPWDHLPGALIVQEAGGVVATWSGQTYTPETHTGGILVASSQHIWGEINKTFLKKLVEEYKITI